MTKASVPPRPRPEVASLHAYVPGEQPRSADVIKLNTNENPFPPSPAVSQALATMPPDALRKYPDPISSGLQGAVAESLGVGPENVLVTNGSDEILRLAAEAFVGPGDAVACLWPTYSLYTVFIAKQGGREVRLPWRGDRAVSGLAEAQAAQLDRIPADTRLVYLTTPNPPFGIPIPLEAIRRVAEQHPEALVVSDEAYIAYGGESALPLVRDGYANVLVTRSFSKSHSLAGQRVGFGVADTALLDLLWRIKDSYNVSAAGQAAALASWRDEPWTRRAVGTIIHERDRLSNGLRELGWAVPESSGNFVFASATGFAAGRSPETIARAAVEHLRRASIYVRYFDTPELSDGMRITVGTAEEVGALLAALGDWSHQGA